MGRGHNRERMVQLLHTFREKVPDVALRTTVLTGFPTENEEAFQELLSFIQSFRFERLGVFPYSHEEDTPAHEYYHDSVPEPEKVRRAEEIMALQQEISRELNEQKIGKSYRVLVDRKEGDYYLGRTQYDSPEVDNEVLISADQDLGIGEFCLVDITGAEEFDLYGSVKTAAG